MHVQLLIESPLYFSFQQLGSAQPQLVMIYFLVGMSSMTSLASLSVYRWLSIQKQVIVKNVRYSSQT